MRWLRIRSTLVGGYNLGGTTLRGVWGIAGDIFAVGDGGRVLRRQGAGAWNQMTSNTGAALNAVFGFGSTSVFAVGAAGTIMRFNGTSWAPMTTPSTTYALRSVWGSSASDVYAAGDAGTLFHFNGTAWSAVPTRLSNDITAVFGTATDDVFIATRLAEVAHFDGVAWARVQLDTGVQIRAIWGVPRQIVFGGEDPFFADGASHRLLRTVPWSCRATETACTDGVDDDCDGARDADDPDC